MSEKESMSRIDIIGLNGNLGDHYAPVTGPDLAIYTCGHLQKVNPGQIVGPGCHHQGCAGLFLTSARESDFTDIWLGKQKAGGASTMAERYPQYYKDVRHLDYIDVYRIHQLYQIDDPSGCLQHADKKILLSGVRTGGKPKIKDIEEARDTLTRWLEMQQEDER